MLNHIAFVICYSNWRWQMLLQSGRWNSHCRVVTVRCFYQKADGIALVNYFILSLEVLIRTSSQMCGRWYLPIFLFRDGLLTLIYRASLMVLIRFGPLSPLCQNFQGWFCDQWCSSGQIWGMGPFDVPWTSLPNALEDSPIYSSSQSTLVTFVSVDDSTLLQHRIFVLWSHQEASDGIASFEVDLHSILVTFLF